MNYMYVHMHMYIHTHTYTPYRSVYIYICIYVHMCAIVTNPPMPGLIEANEPEISEEIDGHRKTGTMRLGHGYPKRAVKS